MGKAARAIIVEDGKLLVMHRAKNDSQYFTLVGGRAMGDETVEQALAREVKEETGMDIASARLVFIEEHPSPYNQQFIFLCTVKPHEAVAIQASSEEGLLNRLEASIHTPLWIEPKTLARLPFRTPQLQTAIVDGLKKGFPSKPVKL